MKEFETIEETGKSLRVTFNYRYAPHNSKVRELIMNDTIGKVNHVHFEWFLNTSHGADYFRRWHRDKRNSGGLLVHKSTHHFDLVNFWLGTKPKQVRLSSVSVRSVRVSAGAGFVVALTGDIMTMPGLPKVPAALNIDVTEDGKIVGLF